MATWCTPSPTTRKITLLENKNVYLKFVRLSLKAEKTTPMWLVLLSSLSVLLKTDKLLLSFTNTSVLSPKLREFLSSLMRLDAEWESLERCGLTNTGTYLKEMEALLIL